MIRVNRQAYNALLSDISSLHLQLTTDAKKIAYLAKYFEGTRNHIVRLCYQEGDSLPTIAYWKCARGYVIILHSEKKQWLKDIYLAMLIFLSDDDAILEYGNYSTMDELLSDNVSLHECYLHLVETIKAK